MAYRHKSKGTGWAAVARFPWGANCEWRNPAFPGVAILHCGHPTALRPYYIQGPVKMPGDGTRGIKFPRLKYAQEYAAANFNPSA